MKGFEADGPFMALARAAGTPVAISKSMKKCCFQPLVQNPRNVSATVKTQSELLNCIIYLRV